MSLQAENSCISFLPLVGRLAPPIAFLRTRGGGGPFFCQRFDIDGGKLGLFRLAKSAPLWVSERRWARFAPGGPFPVGVESPTFALSTDAALVSVLPSPDRQAKTG